MNRLAKEFSKYGVENSLGSQLMVEIGDVRRFANKDSLITFGGAVLGANQSDMYKSKSTHIFKRELLELQKTLLWVSPYYSKTRRTSILYFYLWKNNALRVSLITFT